MPDPTLELEPSLAPAPRALLRRARRVYLAHRGATDRLIGQAAAFAVGPRQDRFFLRAMNEAFAWHFLGCSRYRARCLQVGVTPGDIRGVADLPRIPSMFVTVFKRHTLVTGPAEKVRLTLTSSGTTGERSAIHLDARSLRRIRRIVHAIYRDLQMTGRHRSDSLCFTYDPAIAGDLGTAFSDELLTHLTRVGEVFYAFRRGEDGEWSLDREGCYEALERFERRGRPFRMLGFPAHAWEVLRGYEAARGRTLSFPPKSFVLTGGGWKTLGDREIPKPLFRQEVARLLGIPQACVRDLYGMVEHGVPYTECEHHRMHVPIHARVFVRDPGSLDILPPGQVGVFHFLTPYLSSFPALSLLTTDVGTLERGCPCGREAPVLRLQGRGGVTRHRGCALAALDILEAAPALVGGGRL